MSNNNRPMFIIRNGGKTNLKRNKTSSSTLVDIDNFDELNAEDNVSGFASVIDEESTLVASKPKTSLFKQILKWFFSVVTAVVVAVLGAYLSKLL